MRKTINKPLISVPFLSTDNQWIKYGFDDTPEQVKDKIDQAITAHIQKSGGREYSQPSTHLYFEPKFY
ncbi:MAG: hypothetical protein OSJ68_11290 [Clostridia bacterium]|nr:hypothetical protein [Clostridia bacterium]